MVALLEVAVIIRQLDNLSEKTVEQAIKTWISKNWGLSNLREIVLDSTNVGFGLMKV